MNLKQRMFLEAFTTQMKNISSACKEAGISRKSHYDWLEKNEIYREKFEDIQHATNDFVESKLMSLIGEGNVTAIIFYCKTQMKDRGYIEKVASITNVNTLNAQNIDARSITFNTELVSDLKEISFEKLREISFLEDD